MRVHGARAAAPVAGDFASALIGGVPGDAFALLDFAGRARPISSAKLKSNPQVAAAHRRARAGATASRSSEVLALLSGEVAFYARPGAVIPELTLVLEPKDQSAALATLDKLMARLARLRAARSSPAPRAATR